jgi:hypothetical protein
MRILTHVAIMVLLVAVACTAGCSSDNNNPAPGTTTVIGSGVLAQEDRTVAGLTGLAHASIGDVHVTVGAAEALRVQAEDNLLDHIKTVVRGGTLWIETENGFDIQPTLDIEFQLTVTSLDTIALIGVGEIDAIDLNSNEVNLSHVGVGGIEINALDATDLDATVGGTGDITLAGQVTRQTILISGVGSYEAEQLQSTDADVTISGLGDATVAVSVTLDATISGTGSVFYVGNPVVTSVVTGTGTVEPK